MVIVYLVITEVLIQFVQREKIFHYFHRWNFLKNLLTCRKCIGFWLALLTGAILNVNFFVDLLEFVQYGSGWENNLIFVINWIIYIITQIITAVFTTYGLYYLSVGISAEHQVVIVGNE